MIKYLNEIKNLNSDQMVTTNVFQDGLMRTGSRLIYALLISGTMAASAPSAVSAETSPTPLQALQGHFLLSYDQTDKKGNTIARTYVYRTFDGQIIKTVVKLTSTASVFEQFLPDGTSARYSAALSDGTTGTKIVKGTAGAEVWSPDHMTKSVTYTFPDGRTNTVVTFIAPKVRTTKSGNVETRIETYADGTVITKKFTQIFDGNFLKRVDYSVRTVNVRDGIDTTQNESKIVEYQDEDFTNLELNKNITFSDNTTFNYRGNNPKTFKYRADIFRTRSQNIFNVDLYKIFNFDGIRGDKIFATKISESLSDTNGIIHLNVTYLDGSTAVVDLNLKTGLKILTAGWASDHQTRILRIATNDGRTLIYQILLRNTKYVTYSLSGVTAESGTKGATQLLIKTVRERYPDGTDVGSYTENLQAKISTVAYNGDFTKRTITYTLADNSTVAIATNVVVASADTSASADGSYRLVKRNFTDGTSLLTRVNGSRTTPQSEMISGAPQWLGPDKKRVLFSYNNGTEFEEGVQYIDPTVKDLVYENGIEKIRYKHGNGTVDSDAERLTVIGQRTSTTLSVPAQGTLGGVIGFEYLYGDGTKDIIWQYLDYRLSTPVYTAANYGSNWRLGEDGRPVTYFPNVIYPNVSAVKRTINGVVTNVEDGSSSMPFNELSLMKADIQDPNAIVRSATNTDYDLTWRTPDPNGLVYARSVETSPYKWLYTYPARYGGHLITMPSGTYGCSLLKICIAGPGLDFINLWQQGWTGKGVFVFMEQSKSATENNGLTVSQTESSDFNPSKAGLSFKKIAAGSLLYSMDFNTANSLAVRDDGTTAYKEGMVITGVPKIDVVGISAMSSIQNILYGVNSRTNSDKNLTKAELMLGREKAQSLSLYAEEISRLNNASYVGNYNFTDSIVTKAAGDSGLDAQYDAISYQLSRNDSIYSRLLIVGAINKTDGAVIDADLASYSNFAGKDPRINSRYILAPGDFIATGALADGEPLTSSESTAFAQARVAGYAALLRQKFPNLTAAKSADILLSTATYSGLACQFEVGGCDPAKYGVGIANIGRALAPVGRLR